VPDYTTWTKRSMTQEQWNKTSNDYKNIRGDGVKTLLVLENGVTTLAVVTITNWKGQTSDHKTSRTN
jgi:hypothetical protein